MQNNVQFDEDVYRPVSTHRRSGFSVVQALIRNGLAKDARQANNILLATIIVCIVVIGWTYVGSKKQSEPLPLLPGEFVPE